MLTEACFTEMMEKAAQQMPRLLGQLEQEDLDFMHKRYRVEELPQLVKCHITVRDMNYRAAVLAVASLPAIDGRKRTLVIATDGLHVLKRDVEQVLSKLLEPYQNMDYDSKYTSALGDLLTNNGYGNRSDERFEATDEEAGLGKCNPELKKLPLAHCCYALFPAGDAQQALWLAPSTICEIIDGKDGALSLIHTTYGLTFAVGMRRRTMMSHIKRAVLCHGYFYRSSYNESYDPQSSLASFLGYGSTPVLDIIFDGLDICHLPGRSGDFVRRWRDYLVEEAMRGMGE